MKLYIALSILHFTWTAQAYAEHDPVYQSRDLNPAHLLTRSTNGGLDDAEQALLARDLTSIDGYTLSGSELMARDSPLSLFVKRTNNPPPLPVKDSRAASPQRSRVAHLRDKALDTKDSMTYKALGGMDSKKITAVAGGMLSAGILTGVGAATNWHDPGHAIAGGIAMGCVGAAAFTAACALQAHHLQKNIRNQVPMRRRVQPQPSLGSQTMNGPSPATELQTVPPLQGAPRGHSQPNPNDPSDLVRRYLAN